MHKSLENIESKLYQTTLFELIFESFMLITTAIIIYFFYNNSLVMHIAIIFIIIFRFLVLNKSGDYIYLIIGIVLGGGNDIISMWKKVYYYTPETILPVPIPLWMLLFWGEVFIFFRKIMRYKPFLGKLDKPELLDPPLIADLIIFVILRIVIYKFANKPWVPDAIYSFIYVVRILILPPKPNERKLILTMLILGPIYEIALVKCGLYVYQNGIIFGLPLWLIIWWLFVIRLFKAISDRIEFARASKFLT